ncbi:acyl-CoA dehydrogenase family protein [Mycolicibacterium sphagni]|uniref:acyl-CoA dehydrogenase family protein n=1 Tax=Mycolicibacterium sphagni TaxID=1786 RepID=UPI0021F343F1|nr:acyl-CoA dehydrogenase family protein [Mycolicibacterium sphagni]MCV7177069.1 acyl-CoA dehydrogenase family protein [Mycolicibacterium sphagni]
MGLVLANEYVSSTKGGGVMADISSTTGPYRKAVRRFAAEQVLPYYRDWRAAGAPPRDLWLNAAQSGLLETSVPAAAALAEETGRAGVDLAMLLAHSAIAVPLILRAGDNALQHRWSSALVSGRLVAAAVRPYRSATQDAQACTARAVPDGRRYIVYGQGGLTCPGSDPDLFIVPAYTGRNADPAGLRLFAVEAAAARVGRRRLRLENCGWDSIEVSFDDVVVPAGNVLAEGARAAVELANSAMREAVWAAHASAGAAAEALRRLSSTRPVTATAEQARLRGDVGDAATQLAQAAHALADDPLPVAEARHLHDLCSRIRQHLDSRLAGVTPRSA